MKGIKEIFEECVVAPILFENANKLKDISFIVKPTELIRDILRHKGFPEDIVIHFDSVMYDIDLNSVEYKLSENTIFDADYEKYFETCDHIEEVMTMQPIDIINCFGLKISVNDLQPYDDFDLNPNKITWQYLRDCYHKLDYYNSLTVNAYNTYIREIMKFIGLSESEAELFSYDDICDEVIANNNREDVHSLDFTKESIRETFNLTD